MEPDFGVEMLSKLRLFRAGSGGPERPGRPGQNRNRGTENGIYSQTAFESREGVKRVATLTQFNTGNKTATLAEYEPPCTTTQKRETLRDWVCLLCVRARRSLWGPLLLGGLKSRIRGFVLLSLFFIPVSVDAVLA